MKIKNLLLPILTFAFSWGYCDSMANQKIQIQGASMNQITEHQKESFLLDSN